MKPSWITPTLVVLLSTVGFHALFAAAFAMPLFSAVELLA